MERTNLELKVVEIGQGIEDKVQKLLDEEMIYGLTYTWHEFLVVEIEWGDWKHDHGRADWLIEENFGLKRYRCIITEQDGSDCYSAKHLYSLS